MLRHAGVRNLGKDSYSPSKTQISLLDKVPSHIHKSVLYCLQMLHTPGNPKYMGRFSVMFFIFSIKSELIMTMNCRALICFMNVNYIVSHELTRSLLFQCIESILWVLITFSSGYIWSVVYHIRRWLTVDWFYAIFMGNGVKSWTLHIIRYYVGLAKNDGESRGS